MRSRGILKWRRHGDIIINKGIQLHNSTMDRFMQKNKLLKINIKNSKQFWYVICLSNSDLKQQNMVINQKTLIPKDTNETNIQK
jgi:hypothetical protein